MMQAGSRKEIVFYYESRQNPNGDPDANDRPRVMRDGYMMVTDTRLKQTIREYASRVLGKTTLSLHDDHKKITEKADTILQKSELGRKLDACGADEVIENLLLLTHDVPLFGVMLPIGKIKKGTNGVAKITGPVQFELGRTVNKVAHLNPQISGRFVGASDKKDSTLGKYHYIEYAMIKFRGSVEPSCLEKYARSSRVWNSFCNAEKTLFECLWHGTTRLLTRSKYPQRPMLYAEVEYADCATHNDLDTLLRLELRNTKNPPYSADDFVLVCDGLEKNLSQRNVSKFRIACSHEHANDMDNIVKSLSNSGVRVEAISVEK